MFVGNGRVYPGGLVQLFSGMSIIDHGTDGSRDFATFDCCSSCRLFLSRMGSFRCLVVRRMSLLVRCLIMFLTRVFVMRCSVGGFFISWVM